MALVYARQGQGKFRRDLLRAYHSRCAITDCDATEALDAAHIIPYKGPAFNHITNGLLLRADVHNLFDLGLIAVDTETLQIVISTALYTTQYALLEGRKLHVPDEEKDRPSRKALASHRLWSGL
nr:HNH endonuclease [Agrobacterium tumefaciens]